MRLYKPFLLSFFRVQLTAMHQNENAIRDRKKNKDGTDRMLVRRKKVTNQTPTAYYQKEDATYGEKRI